MLTDYTNRNDPIKIGCPIHGYFSTTYRDAKRGRGCPKCNNTFSEEFTRKIIEKLTDKKWPSSFELWNINQKTGKKLQLDGFCKELMIAFEYDGPQHSKKVFGKDNTDFEEQQYRDEIKNKNCEISGVKLIRFSYTIPHNELLKHIKNELIKNGIDIVNDNINIEETKREARCGIFCKKLTTIY